MPIIATRNPISSPDTLVPTASPHRAAPRPLSLHARVAGWLRLGALACAVLGAQQAQAQATFASGSNDATLLSNLQGSGITLNNATLEAGDRASQVGVCDVHRPTRTT